MKSTIYRSSDPAKNYSDNVITLRYCFSSLSRHCVKSRFCSDCHAILGQIKDLLNIPRTSSEIRKLAIHHYANWMRLAIQLALGNTDNYHVLIPIIGIAYRGMIEDYATFHALSKDQCSSMKKHDIAFIEAESSEIPKLFIMSFDAFCLFVDISPFSHDDDDLSPDTDPSRICLRTIVENLQQNYKLIASMS